MCVCVCVWMCVCVCVCVYEWHSKHRLTAYCDFVWHSTHVCSYTLRHLIIRSDSNRPIQHILPSCSECVSSLIKSEMCQSYDVGNRGIHLHTCKSKTTWKIMSKWLRRMVVFHQGGLSSRWSQGSPGWSLIKVVLREPLVVSHQGGLKKTLGGLSSRWSLIKSPGWSLIKVVSREPWVVSHQDGLRALCARKEAGLGLVPTMAELVTPDINWETKVLCCRLHALFLQCCYGFCMFN